MSELFSNPFSHPFSHPFSLAGRIALVTGAIFLAQMKTFRSHLRKVYVRRGIIPSLEDTRSANP